MRRDESMKDSSCLYSSSLSILLLACINLYRLLVWLKQHILNLINRLRSWDWLIEFWCLITNSKKIIDDCTIHTRLETNHWVFTIAEMVQRRTGKIFKQSRTSQEQLQLRSRSLLTHSLTHSPGLLVSRQYCLGRWWWLLSWCSLLVSGL